MDDWLDVFIRILFVTVFVLAVTNGIVDIFLKIQIANGNIQNIPDWVMWLYLLRN